MFIVIESPLGVPLFKSAGGSALHFANCKKYHYYLVGKPNQVIVNNYGRTLDIDDFGRKDYDNPARYGADEFIDKIKSISKRDGFKFISKQFS